MILEPLYYFMKYGPQYDAKWSPLRNRSFEYTIAWNAIWSCSMSLEKSIFRFYDLLDISSIHPSLLTHLTNWIAYKSVALIKICRSITNHPDKARQERHIFSSIIDVDEFYVSFSQVLSICTGKTYLMVLHMMNNNLYFTLTLLQRIALIILDIAIGRTVNIWILNRVNVKIHANGRLHMAEMGKTSPKICIHTGVLCTSLYYFVLLYFKNTEVCFSSLIFMLIRRNWIHEYGDEMDRMKSITEVRKWNWYNENDGRVVFET